MTALATTETIPLAMDADGAIRVGGTRVPLDTVIAAHERGDSPEEIVDQYPILDLADVYSVIGYVLHHPEEVQEYLAARAKQSEEVRKFVEERFPQEGLREKLLARRRAKGQTP